MRLHHALFALALIAVPSAAHADEPAPFGARAPNVLSVDNLLGATYSVAGDSNDDYEIAAVGSHPLMLELFVSPQTRLGYHRFLNDTVSLGTGLTWYAAGGSIGFTLLGVSPRIGVTFPLSSGLSLWVRAGGGYAHWSYQGDASENDWSLGAEAYLVGTPVSHFGWTFGPMVDVTVSGKYKTERSESKVHRNVYGLTFGFFFDL